MQEFASVSASSSNPSALVDRLNERSAEGWSVVAIVGGAIEVTAFLSREASTDAGAGSAASSSAAVEPGGWAASPSAASPSTSSATSPSTSWSDSSAASTSGATATGATASALGASAAGTASSQMAASSVPAQWAADPTGRYELRYWDGIRWTEHVSRAGQQYTDPL